MTTPDLHALLSRLRAATGPDRDIDREIEHVVCGVQRPPVGCRLAHPTRYTESTNAAEALLTRLRLVFGKTIGGTVYVSEPGSGARFSSTGTTLPIALCIGAVQHVMARGEG